MRTGTTAIKRRSVLAACALLGLTASAAYADGLYTPSAGTGYEWTPESSVVRDEVAAKPHRQLVGAPSHYPYSSGVASGAGKMQIRSVAVHSAAQSCNVSCFSLDLGRTPSGRPRVRYALNGERLKTVQPVHQEGEVALTGEQRLRYPAVALRFWYFF